MSIFLYRGLQCRTVFVIRVPCRSFLSVDQKLKEVRSNQSVAQYGSLQLLGLRSGVSNSTAFMHIIRIKNYCKLGRISSSTKKNSEFEIEFVLLIRI